MDSRPTSYPEVVLRPAVALSLFVALIRLGIMVFELWVVVKRDGALLLVGHEKPDQEPYQVLLGARLGPGEACLGGGTDA